jgi:hypothetical protein
LLFAVLAVFDARADDSAAVARRLVQEPVPPVRGPASPAVAAALMDDLVPAELERLVAAHPELIPGVYGTLGDALARAGSEAAAELGGYLAAVARERGRRLGAQGWTEDDADLLLALQLVDLERFVADAAFRARALAGLPHALDPRAPPRLRDRLLYRLRQLRGVDLDAFEDVAWAWGALVRPSRGRELAGEAELTLGDAEAPIRASVFSLPSDVVAPADATRLLAAVRRAAPARALLVLADRPLGAVLAAHAELGVWWIDTWGFPYSPWPRDPLTFLDEAGGRVVLLRPPNARQGRPEDSALGRALVQGLPRRLDETWRLRWRRAALPFHNGQILDAGGRLWVSLHTFEIRILEILGLDRLPVERFAEGAGERYLVAARQAAAELTELYGRPTAFVHPLPAAPPRGEPAAGGTERAAALAVLGGGAGFDLDSLLTLLPTAGGLAALVADPAAGAELVAAASAAELDGFAAAYGLTPRGEALRRSLLAAQASPRADRLAAFLGVVAGHLSETAAVRRLPLLLVPRELQADSGGAAGPELLVGWNNVVLERRADGPRAEGFASLLAAGDARARQAFAEHGYRLELFPPLVASVTRNGGYRCASQHVR